MVRAVARSRALENALVTGAARAGRPPVRNAGVAGDHRRDHERRDHGGRGREEGGPGENVHALAAERSQAVHVELCVLPGHGDDEAQAEHGLGGRDDHDGQREDLPVGVTELARVLLDEAPGRADAKEITVFDSTGLAVQDLAVAALVYERYRAGAELDGVVEVELS